MSTTGDTMPRMKPLVLATLLASVTTFSACNTTADSSAVAAATNFDVNKILGGIKDKPTADAAKSPLEGAVAALKNMMSGNQATGGTADASSGAKKLGADVLAKFGIDASTLGTIKGLLDNPAIAGAIGPVLNQLKGLIGG